jgi:hypothetical protein
MEGWGKRWGIYLTSREKFVEVRRHFRRFLMVEFEETREQVYFRFYDPWVMGAFSKAWTVRQCMECYRSLSTKLSTPFSIKQFDGNAISLGKTPLRSVTSSLSMEFIQILSQCRFV